MTALLKGSAILHAAGAAALAASPSSWPWIVGTLVVDHAVLAGAGLWPRGRLLGPNVDRLEAAAASRGEVALTFDDGPHAEATPRVFDLLDRRGAKASFFFVGRKAERLPAIVREAAARGHRVENHTWRHSNAFSVLPPWSVAREIDRAQRLFSEITGRAPEFVRAPAGLRPPWIEWVLRRRALRLASWTRRGFDTLDRDPRRVAVRLTRDLAPGDVLLLHEGAEAAPAALEILLDRISADGLRAVPLS